MAKLDTTKLLTVPDAAALLTLKPKTLRAWIAARKIGSVRLGGAVRISTDEVQRLIESGSVPALQE